MKPDPTKDPWLWCRSCRKPIPNVRFIRFQQHGLCLDCFVKRHHQRADRYRSVLIRFAKYEWLKPTEIIIREGWPRRRGRRRIIVQGGQDIWTVSGGLPSLGKRK
jgi:hypothetical protein